MKAIIACVMLLVTVTPMQFRSSLRKDSGRPLNHEETTFWKRLLKDEASLSTDPGKPTSDPPSDAPSNAPTEEVSEVPTTFPSDTTTMSPSEIPTLIPSASPTKTPSETPTVSPSDIPTTVPSDTPTVLPSDVPTTVPSDAPTNLPSDAPTTIPSDTPTTQPSDVPTTLPSDTPTTQPSDVPTPLPSDTPTTSPSDEPTTIPSTVPTSFPSDTPTIVPSNTPTVVPSSLPSGIPTNYPAPKLSEVPSNRPSLKPEPASSPASADGVTSDPDENCQIQAEILCQQIANGKPCDAIQLQTPKGCYGDLASMSFLYDPKPCSQPENICEDFGLLSSALPGSITCTDGDSIVLNVTPSMVNPNETFQIQNLNTSILPQVIKCLITNTAHNAAQIVTIHQSKRNQVEPAQEYGSFQLVDCASKSCVREILQEIVIYNTGDTDVNVSNVTINGNHGVIKLPLPEKQVLPEQFVTFNLTSNVNVCKVKTYSTEVEIEAKNVQGGKECGAQANSTTDILPDCMVDVSMTCTVDDEDGLECSDLSRPTTQCVCETCVDRLVFRYTAARCSAPGPGNKRRASCIDRQKYNISEASDAYIVVTAGDHLLFNGIVTEGSDIVLNGDGKCIGDTIDVLLAPPPGGLGILQNIRLDTSCTYGSEITLLESYGALTLMGYTCLGREENKCFVDVTYNYTAENVGEVDFVLSSFEHITKSAKRNLIQDASAIDLYLPQGEQYEVVTKETLNTCAKKSFSVQLQAAGSTKAKNAACIADKKSSIKLQTECNTPSDMPSDQPSSIPSDSPSSVPSVYPLSMKSSKSKKYRQKCMMSSKSKKSPSPPSIYGPTTSIMSSMRTESRI